MAENLTLDLDCCDFPDLDICDIVATMPAQYQQSSKLQDLFLIPLINQINCARSTFRVMCGDSDCTTLQSGVLTAYGESVGFGRVHCDAACNVSGATSIDEDEIYCRFIQIHLLSKRGANMSTLCEAVTCFFGEEGRILTSTGGVTEIAVGRELTDVEKKYLPLIQRILPHTCGTEIRIYANDAAMSYDIDNIFGINCDGCEIWNDDLCGGAPFLCSQSVCGDPPSLVCPNPLELIVNGIVSISFGNTSDPVQLGGWSISPSLPAGLNFDSQNGFISGAATAVFPETEFTVIGVNPNGEDSCTFLLSVIPAAPEITCSPERIFSVGVQEGVVIASNTGGPIPLGGWSISPPLPAGLTFNSDTAEISGVPTAPSPQTQYLIEATNIDGSSQCLFTLTVTADTSPCVGVVNCQGDDILLTNFRVMTGVGFVPDGLIGQTIGSCSGDISGINITQSFHISGGDVTVTFDTPIPSNWTMVTFEGNGRTASIDLTPYTGLRSFTLIPTDSFNYQLIFSGQFDVTVDCT